MIDNLRFRVYDKETKQYLKLEDYYFWDNCVWIQKWNSDEEAVVAKEDRYDIETCTGMQDKDHKFIFEGDLVKVPNDWDAYGEMAGEVREIYYKDGCFRLKPVSYSLGRGHTLEEDCNKLEIVGNVHDN